MIVATEHLSKWYGHVSGLNDVTVSLPAGSPATATASAQDATTTQAATPDPAAATASARIVPAFTCGMAAVALVTIICASPAMSAARPGPARSS